MTSPFSSSRRLRWLNRMLRERSRSTSCSAFHDSASSIGASNSFSIHAEYKFSVSRFQVLRTGQTPFPDALDGDAALRTAISRVIVAHSAEAPSRTSLACHLPAVGAAISANQKYGGPPCRSRDWIATLPSGPMRDSSPSMRLLGRDDDAQRRALPWRNRRRQHREPGLRPAQLRGSELLACGAAAGPGLKTRLRSEARLRSAAAKWRLKKQ